MSDRGPDKLRFPAPMAGGTGELRLVIDHLELVGTSLSALATAFAVDRFKTAIDMGRCSALLAQQNTVLLTHCHSDHVAGLVAWLSAHTRRHQGNPTRIVVPAERRLPLLQALEAWPDLDGVRRRVELNDVLVGAVPGETFELDHGGWARPFEVHHSSPSLGWALGGPDEGRPLYAFAGDGTITPFLEDPSRLDAVIAVVDCSFVDDGTRVAARLGGHGHIQDWVEILPRLTCDALVLAHLPVEATTGQVSSLIPISEHGPVVVPWIAVERP